MTATRKQLRDLGMVLGWKMNEASGNLTDFIASIVLAATGGSYQQTVGNGKVGWKGNGSTDFLELTAAARGTRLDFGTTSWARAYYMKFAATGVGNKYVHATGWHVPFAQTRIQALLLNSAAGTPPGTNAGCLQDYAFDQGAAHAFGADGTTDVDNAAHVIVERYDATNHTWELWIDGVREFQVDATDAGSFTPEGGDSMFLDSNDGVTTFGGHTHGPRGEWKNVLLTDQNITDIGAHFVDLAPAAPVLTSLNPATVDNASTLTSDVVGNYFGETTGRVIKAKKAAQSDITATINSTTDDQHVNISLDFNGAATGTWDLYAENSFGNTTLVGCITVTAVGSSTPARGLTSPANPAAQGLVFFGMG